MSRFIKDTYVNREYSWLLFNERVLEEAETEKNPLLERCKFLSIVKSNLDEFFMVRVGSLFNDAYLRPKITENKTGLTPAEQLDGIYKVVRKATKRVSAAGKAVFQRLKEEGLRFLNLHEKKVKKLHKNFGLYFEHNILPLLNPIVLDNKHPLIHLENLNMYVFLHLEYDGKKFFGILPVPTRCDRLIAVEGKKQTALATCEDLTYHYADMVFNKFKVLNKALIRITRNAEIDIEIYSVDYEAEYDFSNLMKGKVESRVNLPPVRLELSGGDEDVKAFLCKNLGIKPHQCFDVTNFFDYKFFFGLDKFLDPDRAARLKYPPFKGRNAILNGQSTADGSTDKGQVNDNEQLAEKGESYQVSAVNFQPNVIDIVKQRDLFLSYPYDSMDPYIDLLDQAASDPRVAAVKITIYRLDKQSRIVEALRRASRNGKDVTVLIELMARFDEENNLHFSSVLKEAGCTIVYGVGNYKVHTKITLIVLKENDQIGYVTHLGTGNYNEGTSKIYTDLNVITADGEIGEDAAEFFRNMAMGDVKARYANLLVAPTTLKEGLLAKIREQIALAKEGKPCGIVCKMNSLTDADFIKEFIKASQAGVKVRLIVRGICCLLPGVPGKTENITVKSIVGRFLEHSRIYAFGAGFEDVYISSADLMTRNTSRRVEIATPVKDGDIRKRIARYLEVQLADKEKAAYLTREGKYVREAGEGKSSQQYFVDNVI
ncbi:polyphosphate kinase [Clostridia bacterium]|nr:polyphosphate kinase [Clostridia bacterium]